MLTVTPVQLELTNMGRALVFTLVLLNTYRTIRTEYALIQSQSQLSCHKARSRLITAAWMELGGMKPLSNVINVTTNALLVRILPRNAKLAQQEGICPMITLANSV